MIVYLFIYGKTKWAIKDMSEWYKLCSYSLHWEVPNYIGMIKIDKFVSSLLEFKAMEIEDKNG